MIIIEVYNNKSLLYDESKDNGKLDFNYHEALRNELSYSVPAAEWSQKYKQGIWDGKISLYNKKEQSFPTGLCTRVKNLFEILNINFKFVDKRKKPEKNYPVLCDFGNKELRDYQINSGLASSKFQRGMLALCTGAGKTMTSCYIFNQLSVCPVIFIVPAIELLKQTQKEFEKYLKINGEPVKVGIAGGGLNDLNLSGINVVTYQTALKAFDKKYVENGNKIVDDNNETINKSLAQLQAEYEQSKIIFETYESQVQDSKKIKSSLAYKNYKKSELAFKTREKLLFQKECVRELIKKCQAFIVDEAHVASVVIEELSKFAENAYYKLGLSGTPWRTDNQEIRIEGALGRKIIEVSASDLIDRGFLVKPKIFMCKVNEVNQGHTYAEIYNSNIVNNWERNYRIKSFAEEFKKQNRPTLILVERREHGAILESMIEDAVFVPGGDKGEEDPTDEERNYRRRMLNSVENNEIILIATQWANVGVDAPKISCLILGGSNQSSVTTYQQVGRVLRCVGKDIEESIKNGKPDAIIVDFYSDQKNMKTQSNLRKKVYKNERSWEFYEMK